MSNQDCNCGTHPKEYDYTLPGCFRNDKAKNCLVRAIIGNRVVENTTDLKCLKDELVHVNNTNTTYYMDGQGSPMLIWAGTVETPLYNLDENKFNLRAQWLKTTRMVGDDATEVIFVYYDKDQNYYIFKPTEAKERNK